MRLKSNSLHLNQLKLLIIREYCMLTYDRIPQGSFIIYSSNRPFMKVKLYMATKSAKQQASIIGLLFTVVCFMSCQRSSNNLGVTENMEKDKTDVTEKIVLTDEEWKRRLTPEQYRILRQKGTERAFTNEMKQLGKGSFVCAGCESELFVSDTKYDSGCGWPSFYDTVDKNNITQELDSSFSMKRIEVLCSRCGGHLGHIFNDGPQPTGLRYCINGGAIKFQKDDEDNK